MRGDPLPSAIDILRLQEIYDRTAAFYDEVVAEHQAKAKEQALELLARHPGERFLEVGCGTGWAFRRVLSRSGPTGALGIDAAPGMLAVAGRRLLEEHEGGYPPLALADARALPFAAAAFDCLLTTYTLEVLPLQDITAVLQECLRVLRPGGRLVAVNLTEGEGEDAAVTEEWKRGYAADPEYFSGSRPLLLSGLIERAGFRDVRRQYSGHGRGWPSEIISAFR